MSEVMRFSHGRIHWDIWLRRPMQDWEEEALDLCWGMLYSTNVQGFGADKVCWKPTVSKGFEVRDFYHALSPSSDISFPWKIVWQSKIPPRVVFFSWTASLHKILTTGNL